jgi:hypothetical protein
MKVILDLLVILSTEKRKKPAQKRTQRKSVKIVRSNLKNVDTCLQLNGTKITRYTSTKNFIRTVGNS